MKLLSAEPTVEPAEAPPEGVVEAPVRTCTVCGAAMDPAQDWCLECGTAAAGRLGGGAREAFRAASTVVGLTLLLVLGAVAASYAALTDDSTRIAQAPPAAPITPTVASAPAVVPADEVPTTPADPEPLPEVTLPEADASEDPDLPEPTPVTPSSPPAPITPGPSASSTPSAPAAPSGPVDIDLPRTAGSLFDPYGNAVSSNAPARALDGSAGTSWQATAAPEAETLSFGYAIEVEDPADVSEVLLQTKTPGFRVEVYGTTSKTLPPDVLDDRWIHLRDRADVDATVGGAPKDGNRSGDGEERITLGDNAGGKKLRHVLLWFTLVPENGPTIRLTEVSLRA